MTPVIRIIYNDVIAGKMADKKNCLNTITVNKACQKIQITAFRVTNNSHFREASSLKSCILLHFNFPNALRQQGTFLYTTQYL